MKFWRLTLGFGALAALIAATFDGVTWTDTCSGDSLQILCVTRGDVMVYGGVFGFLLGTAFGPRRVGALEAGELCRRLGLTD